MFRAVFNEPVNGVDVSDFRVNTSGSVSASIFAISGSGTTYDVTVSILRGQGSVNVALNGSGTGITDLAGNLILTGFGAGTSHFVDLEPPPAPTVTAGFIATNNLRPTFTGVTEPGATVRVSVDGSEVGTAVSFGSGAWSFTMPTNLSEGPHFVTARAVDLLGNVSAQSPAYNFIIDTVAPTITSVAAPAGATYRAGQALDFTVNFSEPIVVSGGTPSLSLTIGSSIVRQR